MIRCSHAWPMLRDIHPVDLNAWPIGLALGSQPTTESLLLHPRGLQGVEVNKTLVQRHVSLAHYFVLAT